MDSNISFAFSHSSLFRNISQCTSRKVDTATLDQDATLVSSNKNTALYCYKKYQAYQPFNTYWHEQGLLLSSEFRDGNVPAGFEQLRLLKESLSMLPERVVCKLGDIFENQVKSDGQIRLLESWWWILGLHGFWALDIIELKIYNQNSVHFLNGL